MPRPLLLDIRSFGGLCRRADLLRLGHDRHALTRAVRTGLVRVPRRGWVVAEDAPANAVRAVELGGVLGGASALASYGVWIDDEVGVVVSVPPSSSAIVELRPGERKVWKARVDDRAGAVPWRVSVIDALLQLALDAPRDSLVASVDSALNLRLLSAVDYTRFIAALPRRLRSIAREVDGNAASGTETHMRLALVRAGYRVRTQVRIPGVGTVDILVDDWLIIELDSRQHHGGSDNQFRDRTRDGNAVLAAYGHERFVWAQVRYDIDWCVRVVEARLREGRPSGSPRG